MSAEPAYTATDPLVAAAYVSANGARNGDEEVGAAVPTLESALQNTSSPSVVAGVALNAAVALVEVVVLEAVPPLTAQPRLVVTTGDVTVAPPIATTSMNAWPVLLAKVMVTVPVPVAPVSVHAQLCAWLLS